MRADVELTAHESVVVKTVALDRVPVYFELSMYLRRIRANINLDWTELTRN
jgi:hypothetical protein